MTIDISSHKLVIASTMLSFPHFPIHILLLRALFSPTLILFLLSLLILLSPPPPPTPPQRVKSLTQNVKYNDPLREYVDIIVKKFPPEIRAQFSKGHDDFEDFVPSQDVLTKGSLESLYKKVTKAVRLSHSTKV